MSEQFEHHKNLIIGMITGTLTDEEALELERLRNDHTDFQRLYREVVDEFPPELRKDNFKMLDQPGFWKDLEPSLHKSRGGDAGGRLATVRRIAAVAAAMVAALVLGWLLYSDAPTKVPATVSAPATAGIRLQLATGKQIDLSAVSGTFKEGNATLTSNNKALQYSVNDQAETGINSIMVPAGMDYRIELSDGSVVWLNAASRLDFPFNFTGPTREVTITGEAYLEVATNKNKPFIVRLPNTTVAVTGTEFNVNTYDPDVDRVSLVNGAVSMSAPERTIQLQPGTEGVYQSRNKNITSRPFSSRNVLGWRDGLYYFDEADLTEISEVLKRWFKVDVVMDDITLDKRKFKGVLNKKEPLSTFLNDLQAISKINYHFDGNGTLHFK